MDQNTPLRRAEQHGWCTCRIPDRGWKCPPPPHQSIPPMVNASPMHYVVPVAYHIPHCHGISRLCDQHEQRPLSLHKYPPEKPSLVDISLHPRDGEQLGLHFRRLHFYGSFGRSTPTVARSQLVEQLPRLHRGGLQHIPRGGWQVNGGRRNGHYISSSDLTLTCRVPTILDSDVLGNDCG